MCCDHPPFTSTNRADRRMGPPPPSADGAAPSGGWLRRSKVCVCVCGVCACVCVRWETGSLCPRPTLFLPLSSQPEPPPPPTDPASAQYDAHRRTTDLGFPYRVPASLLAGTRPTPPPPPTPETPLLVFVNAAAGGRAGPALAAALRRALGADQVFDVAAHTPGDVLRALYANLDGRAAAGDYAAISVRSRLVLLVAGGDGTVAWVLKTVSDLGVSPPPAVAVLPLGTGNDLALSFGWGHRYARAWAARHDALYATLKRVADGEPRDLDAWSVTVARPEGAPAFEGLPHALEPENGRDVSTARTASGRFWNYLSVGNDAQATHGFHTLRDARPWAAPGRLINQVSCVGCGSAKNKNSAAQLFVLLNS